MLACVGLYGLIYVCVCVCMDILCSRPISIDIPYMDG